MSNMDAFLRNLSRDTFSSQIKSTLTLRQRMEQLKITPDDKKMRSDFVSPKSIMNHAHTLPMNRRLAMYNLNRPLSPPRYFMVKTVRKRKSKKLRKSPNVRMNLGQRTSVSVQCSPRCSPLDSPRSQSMASPPVINAWIKEDNIETLVQKYGPYEGDDEHSTD